MAPLLDKKIYKQFIQTKSGRYRKQKTTSWKASFCRSEKIRQKRDDGRCARNAVNNDRIHRKSIHGTHSQMQGKYRFER